MRLRILLGVFVFAAVLSPRVAEATNCSGDLSTCINDDTLWPHAGPSDFEAVGSSATVARDHLGFGLVASYLSQPIVFKLAPPGGTKAYAINDQVNGTFLWSYGMTEQLELDLALPVTFGQGGAGLQPLGGANGVNDTAVRDLRFGLAYAFLPPPVSSRPTVDTGAFRGGVTARFEVSAPTGDRDQFAGERAAVFVPSLAADFHTGRWFGGLEVGARIRPTAQLLGARVGSQIVTSAGVGVDVLPHRFLSAALEAWALETLVGQEDAFVLDGTYSTRPNNSVLVPAEWQFSLRTAPLGRDDLTIQAGGGSSIPFASDGALTAPRFRFVLGIRWAPIAHPAPAPSVAAPLAE